MYEFEKIALSGERYQRDGGGVCYRFPNDNYYRVNSLTAEQIAKGYQVFTACADLVTIPRAYFGLNVSEFPVLTDRDIVTVQYQFVTRAKTRRGIIDAAARRAYELGPWHYMPACVSAIWGNGVDIVKDIKLVEYHRLGR